MKTEEEYNAEVLQLMRDLYPTLKGEERKRAERLFPELKESEDEKIKEQIIYAINQLHVCDCTKNKLRAWFENHGEQKPADKVEPKFKTGTYVVYLNDTYMLEDDGKHYILTAVKKNASTPVVHIHYGDEDYTMRKWNIADAKDGDVLVDKDNNIGIYKEIEGIFWNSYIYLGCDGKLRGFSIGGSHEQTDTHPATKEQRDLLFSKMKEAGYTWDAEKKELKKIGQKKEDASELTEFEAELFSMMNDAWQGYLRGEEVNIAEIVKEHSSELLERANEQKPAWSEEDEYYLNSCITKIEIDIQNWGSYGKTMIDDDKEIISWLKSLKERIQSHNK